MNGNQVEDYLARIDYSGSRSLTADTLDSLIRAHIARVPFENLDVFERKLVPSLEIPDIHIQPDGLGQVKFPAQSRQAVEDLGSPAVLTVITDDMVLQQVVLFEYFTP